MRSTARISTAGRASRALIGLTTMVGFAVLVPAVAHADPVGCTRTPNGSGDNIVCTAGIPGGQTLTGTAGNDKITITGGPVNGTVSAGAGNDTITITGTAGTVGSTGGTGAPGSSTHPAGFAGTRGSG